VAVVEGSRYQEERNGLRITNITTADDGEYTCRAEVDEDGRYDERKIAVKVHSNCLPHTRTHAQLHVVSIVPYHEKYIQLALES